jgi:hypothetical protein
MPKLKKLKLDLSKKLQLKKNLPMECSDILAYNYQVHCVKMINHWLGQGLNSLWTLQMKKFTLLVESI